MNEVLTLYLSTVVAALILGAIACIVDRKKNRVVFSKKELTYVILLSIAPVLNGIIIGQASLFILNQLRRK